MNGTQRTRTLPYLAFLLAFVLLVGRGYFGFQTQDEGCFIAAVHRFSCGFLPFIDEWGIQQGAAWLVTPLYSLYLQLAGSATSVLLIARMTMAVLALAVCTVTFRMLRPTYGPVLSCCLCLSLPLSLLSLSPSPGDALGILFLSLTFILGWNTWQLAAHDSNQPGVARVACPLLCGAFAVLSVISCGILALAAAIILAVLCPLALLRCGGRPSVAAPWIACGVLVAAACYACLTFIASDPGQIAANAANLHFFEAGISISTALFLVVAAVLSACAFLGREGRFAKQAPVLGGIVAIVLLACGLSSLISCRLAPTTQLEEGPASGISVSSEEAAAYNGILELAAIANTGDVVAFTQDSSWAATAVTGNLNQPSAWCGRFTSEDVTAYYEKRLYPEWVLVPASSADSSAASDALGALGTYGVFKSNDFGTLYKRASKLSYIN